MRGSLLIFHVLLRLLLNTSVLELLCLNGFSSVVMSAGASPVPVESSHELESRDLLVSQVCYDFEHAATVAVRAEHLEVEETGSVDGVLQEQGAPEETSEDPPSVLRVLIQLFLHLSLLIIISR